MCKCLRKEELYDGEKFVALTFDDGPTPGITDQVLDVLKENDIVASFSDWTENYRAVGVPDPACI